MRRHWEFDSAMICGENNRRHSYSVNSTYFALISGNNPILSGIVPMIRIVAALYE